MGYAHTVQAIRSENIRFTGTAGISRNNRSLGFQPGFYDEESGKMAISRFSGGQPAPFHTLDGVPGEWVTKRSASGKIVAVKRSVISGFLFDGRFLTRAQAAEMASEIRHSA